MRSAVLPYALMLCVLANAWIPATAGVPSKVTREVIEETLEHAARRSGREISEQTAKKAATAARRALARNLPDLLPLARRVGTEALELEVRTPGLAAKVFATFGDDAGRVVAKNVPTEDVPRLLSYAEKADSPATRDLLVQSYRKEGPSLFERIPAKLVLASGLTASMLYGTYRLTEPAKAMGDAIRNSDDVAGTAVRHFIAWGAVCVFALATVLLWRFRLMPWHGRKNPTVETKEELKTGTSEQSPAPLRETRDGSREGEA